MRNDPQKTHRLESFDPKCYELAEYFLPASASEERKSELAGWIQYHIELFLVGDKLTGESI